MHRRFLMFAAAAALILIACTSTGNRPFVSDRITVVTRGTGPDIIFIPGLTGSRDLWDGVAETLDDRYRLHLVQVNGFAGTAPGANAEGTVSARSRKRSRATSRSSASIAPRSSDIRWVERSA